jgi:hypothetical protein
MYYLNLFQDEINRDRAIARDPLRWSKVLSALILTIALFLVSSNYWEYQKARIEYQHIQSRCDELRKNIDSLKNTDVGKLSQLQKDTSAIDKRIQEHVRVATLLDTLASLIPSNVQITEFHFGYELMPESSQSNTVVVFQPELNLDLITQSSNRLVAFRQRDALIDLFQTSSRWKTLVGNLNGSNHVEMIKSVINEGKQNQPVQVHFKLKLPFNPQKLQ